MIASHGLRWILTALFAAVTLLSVVRAVRPGIPGPPAAAARITHGLHALMGVAMAVMAWPRGMDVPAVPQAVFFALAAAWFPASLVLGGRRTEGAPGEQHPRAHVVSHALMMGAMAWMPLAMPEAMSGGHSSGSGAAAMPGMPGMSMSGSGGGMSMQLRGADRTAAVVLLVVFVLLGLWWLSRAFDAGRLVPAAPAGARGPAEAVAVGGSVASVAPVAARSLDEAAVRSPDEVAAVRGALDAGCHGAMALGMAVMLLAMV